jgi:hypothetical protein
MSKVAKIKNFCILIAKIAGAITAIAGAIVAIGEICCNAPFLQIECSKSPAPLLMFREVIYSLNAKHSYICLIYPFKFDDTQFSATESVVPLVLKIIEKQKNFKLIKSYSNSSYGENFSDVSNSGEQASTILKLTGEVKYWNDDEPISLVLTRIELSKFDNRKWVRLSSDTLGNISQIPRFPKIWQEQSIDRIDAFLSRQAEFKVLQGVTDQEKAVKTGVFTPEVFLNNSINNARDKITEQRYIIVKQIVIERAQNDFQTTITYIPDDF